MSGVTIIGALLNAHAPLLAFIPSDRIKAGALPDGIALPALLVRSISTVARQPLKRGATVRTVERVSIAVRVNSYREQKRAMRLICDACAGKTGSIGGFDRVSVLTAGTGPDARGPANSFEQTQDFRVSFDARTTNEEDGNG